MSWNIIDELREYRSMMDDPDAQEEESLGRENERNDKEDVENN